MKKRKGLALIASAIALVLTIGTVSADVNGSGWWSAISVQRVGRGESPATVIMMAYAKEGQTGGPWECGSRILPTFGSGATFFPHWASDPTGSNCANASGFPANYQGSGILSSDDAIVAIVQTQNIRFGGFAPGDVPYGRAVAAYAGVSSPATELKFPLYKNNHNNEMTTFYIQNTGNAEANIVAVFKPCADQGTGTPCLGYPNVYTYTYNGLDPNKMLVIDATLARDAQNNPMPAGRGSFGGLTIQSTQPIAGVVFEHHRTASPATYLKATRGLGPSDYDTKIYVPSIKYQYPQGPGLTTNPNLSKWSGLVVHNADTVNVTVRITYTLAARNGNPNHPEVGTKYYHGPVNLNPGESAFFLFHDGLNPAPGTQKRDLLSAEIGATGKIVAIVNEEGDYSISGMRDYATYFGMPASMAANVVSLPSYKEQYNGKFHGAIIMNVGNQPAVITATLTVVGRGGRYTGPMNPGNTVRIRTTNPVSPGASIVLFMSCKDYYSQWTDLAGDTHQKADLCSGSPNPTGGVNTALIVESDQPIVVLANEELLWYENPATRADGQGEDASNYEGFPLR